jgi:hypothetical protein
MRSRTGAYSVNSRMPRWLTLPVSKRLMSRR